MVIVGGMGIKKVKVNRTLQLWIYSPSLSRMLLVANKASEYSNRKILLFQGVENICIRTAFYCSKITWDDTKENKTFLLHSNEKKFTVNALLLLTDEDNLEYDAPIPLYDDMFKI